MGSTNLEEELLQLGDDLLAVAAITADAILNSVEMLRYKDKKRLLALTKSVEVVHTRQFQIQRLAYSIRVAQLPYGHDLRLLTSIPDVCIELGRIGRYAQSIAELAARRDGLEAPALIETLQNMARRTADILQRAVSAFINQDLQSAQFIVTQAALVDAAYYRVYCEGLDYVEAEPAIAEHVRLQFTVAYDLQCVAHHIAHLCERTSYIVMGEWPKLTKFTADDLLVAVE